MSRQNLEGYEIREDGILMYRHIIYVPNDQELKGLILSKMHKVPYAGHLGYQKIIFIVKKQYYWTGMKKKVVDFIIQCLKCQKVKVEYKHPAGFLQKFPIIEWKWEVITMDFIIEFPRNVKQHDSIMVVVDKLTQVANFIPVKLVHKEANIDDIFMREVARLHGIPKIIVSDRDSNFT
jgi:hypothetical protein